MVPLNGLYHYHFNENILILAVDDKLHSKLVGHLPEYFSYKFFYESNRLLTGNPLNDVHHSSSFDEHRY
ncbi:hypothetical protein BLOT_000713 [Blomia tropicalis]|nr:hypothetical protein BLOT_000713 [Blomia tropicalis]